MSKLICNLKKAELHAELHVRQGDKIPMARLRKPAKSRDTALRKRAQLAINAGGFKH